MSDGMTLVAVIAGVMLAVAAGFTAVRLLRGPDSLDRLVSVDTLIALVISGLAVFSATSGNTTVVPAIVALALLSFVGSVSVTRWRNRDGAHAPDDGGAQ